MWRCCASGWCKRANKTREFLGLITDIDRDGHVHPHPGGLREVVRMDRRNEFKLADDLSMFGPTLKGTEAHHQKLGRPPLIWPIPALPRYIKTCRSGPKVASYLPFALAQS